MENGVLAEISDFIRSRTSLLAFGGQSKNALQVPKGSTRLELSDVSGVLEYNPDEFTFTALAGTRLKEVEQMLGGNGQAIPFDPPLVEKGGTLGGTVAAGLSGPGRYRNGGIRDFILGVKYLDDEGRAIQAGGKVVKNAAGFDIPKFMVGSLGYFGALVELSFKVFPKPREYRTVRTKFDTLEEALDKLVHIKLLPMEIESLELEPDNGNYYLFVRLAGESALFSKRTEKIIQEMGDSEIMEGKPEIDFWLALREFSWVALGRTLVKVPITTRHAPTLDKFLDEFEAPRRYSVGANVAWISWADQVQELDDFLVQQDLAGLALLGSPKKIKLGHWKETEFYSRIKTALDPSNKWAGV